jgi:hypothetical protein
LVSIANGIGKIKTLWLIIASAWWAEKVEIGAIITQLERSNIQGASEQWQRIY